MKLETQATVATDEQILAQAVAEQQEKQARERAEAERRQREAEQARYSLD